MWMVKQAGCTGGDSQKYQHAIASIPSQPNHLDWGWREPLYCG